MINRDLSKIVRGPGMKVLSLLIHMKVLIVALIIVFLQNGYTATYNSTGNVNFTSPTNWSPAPTVPIDFTSGLHDFIVNPGDAITIDAAITVNSLTLNNTTAGITQGGYDLQIVGTLMLTSGTLNMGSNYIIASLVDVNGGSLNTGSSNQHQFNLQLSNAGTFNAGTSTIEMIGVGNITVFSKSGVGTTFDDGTATFKFKPTTQTGTVSSTLTITSDTDIDFNNVIFEGVRVSGFGATHALTFDVSTFNIVNSFERTGRATTVGGTGSLSYNTDATLIYNANSVAFTVGNEWPDGENDRPTNVVNESSFNVTMTSDKTVSGTLTLDQSGGNFEVEDALLTITGKILRKTAGIPGLTLTGSTTGILTYSGDTSELEYNTSAGTQIGDEWPIDDIDSNAPSNVTVTNTSGGVYSSGDISRTIAQDLALNTGSLSLGTGILTVSGSVDGSDISGSAILDNDTKLFIGDGATSSKPQTITGSLTLKTLEIDKQNGVTAPEDNTVKMLGSSSLTFTTGGSLTITNGILDLNGTGRVDSLSNLSLTVGSGGTLKTGGQDFTGLSVPTLTGGTVDFSGALAETMLDWDFTNLTISNSNANGVSVSANTSPTVSGTFILANGVLYTGASNSSFTIESIPLNIPSGSDGSYIDGPVDVETNGTTEVILPLGNLGVWHRLGITPGGSGLTTYRAEFNNSDPQDGGRTARETGVEVVSNVNYWTVTRPSGSQTAQIRLYWESGSEGVGDPGDLLVVHWTNNQWEDGGNNDPHGDSNSGDVRSSTAYSTSFGDFALGSTNADDSLPISLSIFKAEPFMGGVALSWSTESELDNQGFNVYRRKAKENIEWQLLTAALIPGAGNTAESNDYDYFDKSVAAGQSYEYMLESVSYAGVRIQEKVVEVDVPMPTEYAVLGNYPNPFNPTTKIQFNIPDNMNNSVIQLNIYDIQGNLVNQLFNGPVSSGFQEIHTLNFSHRHYISL